MLRNGNDCRKNESNENIMANISNTDYERSITAGECGIFKLFW
jgi:hypothetical protein